MSEVVKNIGTKTFHGPIDVDKLAKIIEDAYESYNEPTFMTKKSFSPSKIGYGHGRCPRYWYIAFDGAEFIEKSPPQSVANMLSGTMSHDRIAELLQKSDLDISYIELELTHDDPPIRGFIDVGINRAGEEIIGEVKTTRTEAFRARQAKMEPPDYHLIQILIYMYIRDAKSGFFLYEDKNTHDILLMPVYMTDAHRELVENTFDWMRGVRKAWEEQTLPQIPFRSNAKECKSCPLRETCFDETKYGKGDIKIEPLRLVQ